MNHNNKLVTALVVILLAVSFGVIAYQLGSMNEGPKVDSQQADLNTDEENLGQENDVEPNNDSDSEGNETMCTKQYDPVCGKVGGENQNFGNLCEAEKAGAENIEPGVCPLVTNPNDEEILCPDVPGPACGVVNGKKTNFDNACLAQQAGATDITQGACPTVFNSSNEKAPVCEDTDAPVCGMLNGKKINYKNECEAKKAGSTEINEGKCTLDIKI